MQIYAMSDDSDNSLVATIVEFDNGKVVTNFEIPGEPQSVAVWNSLKDALSIHSRNSGWSIVKMATIVVAE